MSVIGIDFGNESCYVAVARAGGIETVDNDYSLRATSTTVAFGEKQRILGVPAKNQLVTNIKNTIWGFKRLLGRRWDEPLLAEEIKKLPFQVIPDQETNSLGVKVRYLGESQTFSIEQIAAMLFTKLKETTEQALRTKISDCVISVPSFYTNCERRALLAAATMAGFHVLRLMNDTAATALTYGIYKQDLPEAAEKPRNVVFVDCGHSALQVWACAFNKGKLKILAATADPNLGGRDFDKVLAEHFCREFQTKYNINVQSNHRAYVRLLTEVEKLKRQMSANATKLPLNIECLMDDKDVTSSMCRADFEVLSASLLQRVESTLKMCWEGSKLQVSDIHSVEIVGGSSRVPAIKHLIEQVFGKVPSTTLNQDEAVARGCALQCAILSPAYKVKDFKISDVQPYPIKVVWDEKLGEDGCMEVFPQYHPLPFKRVLTFYKKDEFQLAAQYSSPVPYPSQEIGVFRVRNVNSGSGDPLKVKCTAHLDINGMFTICNALAFEKCENGEELMETEPPQEVNNTSAAAADTENSHESPQEEATTTPNGEETGEPASEDTSMAQDASETPVEAAVPKKKKFYKEVQLPIEQSQFGITEHQVQIMLESEGKMMAEDRREKERIDAKNALEEYVYMLRDKLDGELSQFVEENEKAKLGKELSVMETWLYEEGSEENRQAYSDRLQNLKNTTDPIFMRHQDYLERPAAIRELDISIQLARKVVDMKHANELRYEHLDPKDIEKLQKAIHETQQWLDHTREILHSVKIHMQSPILASEIIQHRKGFEAVVHPVMNKPKPKAPSPKPRDEQDDPLKRPCADANADVTDGKANNTAKHEQQPQQPPQEMDVE